ncbi:MAG: hypothetical protein H0W86_12060 [Armatimonadetes bacterium]|nr:hypothetical protein [Armatimonadota bacterium]
MTSEDRKLLFIQGDISGAMGAILYYWPIFFKFRLRENPGYDYATLFRPNVDNAVQAIAQADAFIYYGHGNSGGIWLRHRSGSSMSQRLAAAEVRQIAEERKQMGKGPLNFVQIAGCDTLRDQEWIDAWLEVAMEVRGFDEVTYNWRRPFRIPKEKRFRRPSS